MVSASILVDLNTHGSLNAPFVIAYYAYYSNSASFFAVGKLTCYTVVSWRLRALFISSLESLSSASRCIQLFLAVYRPIFAFIILWQLQSAAPPNPRMCT